MSQSQPPTPRQLAYLRVLAERTETTFTPPKDRQQASREIERLKVLERDSDDEDRSAVVGAAETYAPTAHPKRSARRAPRAKPSKTGRTTRSARSRRGGRGSRSTPVRTAKARRLGSYTDADNKSRHVLAVKLTGGTLVIDARTTASRDARLVGRLDPDEPAKNADILARLYLGDASRGRCRPVTAQDLRTPNGASGGLAVPVRWDVPLVAGIGILIQIGAVDSDGQRELRWVVSCQTTGHREALTLRRVIGLLQDYEPAVAMTRAAITAHRRDEDVSVVKLESELRRACNSPIVLNRRLRERVKRAVASDGITMSEIAIRCRRVKRDDRGNESGETSWLARRVGIMPEAGAAAATPWIHSKVLALIARDGLGLSPLEVEVPLEH